MERYIVLRKPLGTGKLIRRSASAGSPGLATLAVERVPRHALSDLSRDPEVLAVTPPMATALIRPVQGSSAQHFDRRRLGHSLRQRRPVILHWRGCDCCCTPHVAGKALAIDHYRARAETVAKIH
jgi:hypothetical protein